MSLGLEVYAGTFFSGRRQVFLTLAIPHWQYQAYSRTLVFNPLLLYTSI